MKTITLTENQIRLLSNAMVLADETGMLELDTEQDEQDWEILSNLIEVE